MQQGGKGRDEVDEDCGSGYEYVPKREDEDAKMDKVCFQSCNEFVEGVFSDEGENDSSIQSLTVESKLYISQGI